MEEAHLTPHPGFFEDSAIDFEVAYVQCIALTHQQLDLTEEQAEGLDYYIRCAEFVIRGAREIIKNADECEAIADFGEPAEKAQKEFIASVKRMRTRTLGILRHDFSGSLIKILKGNENVR